jgi:hypothetical protein
MEAMTNQESLIQGVSEGADDAKRIATDMAASAKSGVADTVERIGRVYATLRNFGLDDALSRIGLQKRRSGMYSGAVGFGAGFLTGAVTAMLVAPQSGLDTRRLIERKVRALLGAEVTQDVPDKTEKTGKKGRDDGKDNGADAFDQKQATRSPADL